MRPYLSGGYEYVFEDTDERASDNGNGVWLNAGKAANEFWGYEFGAFYNEFERLGPGAPEWTEFGAELSGLFFYSRSAQFAPYFIGTLGYAETDLEGGPVPPGASLDSGDPFAALGLGFFKYFTQTSLDLGFRADLRYRWLDPSDFPPGGPESFGEPVLRLGLVMPLGARPVAAEPAAAAAGYVVPAGAAISTGVAKANDGDGDGVMDDSDNCPATAGGLLVDKRGCPIDTDYDGVTDNLDNCPGTARGLGVDGKGCPQSAADAGANRSFENVNFAFDRSELTDYAKATLDNAASVIGGLVKKYPGLKIDILGHTDWIGTDAYNQALSERRANAVKGYLVRKGVEADRISNFAYGESKPIAPNETDEGRALNRRAEIRTHE